MNNQESNNSNIEISPFGSLLVYKKGYTPQFVFETIQQQNLNGLRIFIQFKEDKLSDLEFLTDYSFLGTLDITSVDDYNFNFLSALNGLKKLSINVHGKNPIDLSNQKNLESLTINWRKGIKGIDQCQNLKKLCLVDFKEADLLAIKELKNLEELLIKTATIKYLNGLESLKLLAKIVIGNCKNLTSIRAIDGLTSLSYLECALR
jgi:hypothetical protein